MEITAVRFEQAAQSWNQRRNENKTICFEDLLRVGLFVYIIFLIPMTQRDRQCSHCTNKENWDKRPSKWQSQEWQSKYSYEGLFKSQQF